ncbi:hypothetical protein TUM12151_29990 [Morganella morganii]|nr:hypothetical protein TUM12149_19450 [Morganella morganii]GIZ31865.1 hypothetical protein TUM12150_23510 [Morganella morganii]GIZ36013.1 hypothetical protein TUM12151_29990 [Morganella morganii]
MAKRIFSEDYRERMREFVELHSIVHTEYIKYCQYDVIDTDITGSFSADSLRSGLCSVYLHCSGRYVFFV